MRNITANLLLSERFSFSLFLFFFFQSKLENVAAAFLHTRAHVDFFLIFVSFQISKTPFAVEVLNMARFVKANAWMIVCFREGRH